MPANTTLYRGFLTSDPINCSADLGFHQQAISWVIDATCCHD